MSITGAVEAVQFRNAILKFLQTNYVGQDLPYERVQRGETDNAVVLTRHSGLQIEGVIIKEGKNFRICLPDGHPIEVQEKQILS